MANTIYLFSFVETPRKFIIAELKELNEDPSLRIESSAIINLRGVSTKLNKYILYLIQCTMCEQTFYVRTDMCNTVSLTFKLTIAYHI